MDAKTWLRLRLSAQRAALTACEIAQKSAAIAARVCALPAFLASQTVMVYLALSHEVQTTEIITVARRQHKRIVVPVIRGASLLAVALPWDMAQVRRGPYGIREPRDPIAVIDPRAIDFVVVPGLAFDRWGGRLGFGKGYYDRFLSQLPTAASLCGVAFCVQMVSRVPQEAHDVCMSYVITEQESVSCESSAASRPE